MPGDIGHLGSIGIGEGKPIWERMAMLMRCARLLLAQSPKCPGITSAQPRPRAARSLDLRILMDAHDRRNYGFVDVPTFRRRSSFPMRSTEPGSRLH